MYTKKEHVHFVGIGGIGMSGIALLLKQQGYTISGCDNDLEQHSIKQLIQHGCTVYRGNNSIECTDQSIDILVYISSYITTIPAIRSEVEAAQNRAIPTVARAQMLQELMRSKYSIGVTGSHGKTTTTALIAHILLEAGIDPTVIIGGHCKRIKSNAYAGSGPFIVAEVDESDRSFLHLYPTLAVITNIDREHLETYTDLTDIRHTFRTFTNNIPFYGKAIVCLDDDNIRSLLPLQCNTVTYGLTDQADIYAKNIELHAHHSLFTVHEKKSSWTVPISLPLAGIHNVHNALGAIMTARTLCIDFSTIASALSTFQGVERRFSYRGTYKDADIFDDYGHHPKEIEHTLLVARKKAHNKLTVIFQPHRYTRTAQLWDDFITTFITANLDILIITDIHAASEQPIDGITSQKLVKQLQSYNLPFPVIYLSLGNNFCPIKEKLAQMTQPGDLLLFLGAGTIYQLAHELAD